MAAAERADSQPLLPQEQDDGVDYSTISRSTDALKADVQVPEYTWIHVLMMASTWVGVFLASIDSSIMATLSGPISHSFDSFQLMPWFINAYLAAGAAITPLSGKLSDIYGRRNGLLLAHFLFLSGNLICGLATESWHFILGRVIGGLGGGCIHSISTFLITDLIPLRSRGLWQGFSNIAYGVGFAIGGTLGGLIQARFGWRWAFLAQPPLLAVSMILIMLLIPRSLPVFAEHTHRIDYIGSLTLTTSIVLLMWSVISGGNVLPWTSPAVFVPLLLSPVTLIGFYYIESEIAAEPIIPVRLLKVRTVIAACFAYWLGSAAYAIVVYFTPLFLEVDGLAPAAAGLRLAPNAIGLFFGSLTSGYVMNLTGRYYALGVVSQSLPFAAAIVTTVFITKIASSWLLFLVLAANGLGYGGTITVLLVALISAVDHRHHATLTSASYAFRSTGSTIGITLAGSLFQNILKTQLWTRFGQEEDAQRYIDIIRSRLGDMRDIPQAWRSGVFSSYLAAFHGVFILMTWIWALSTLMTTLLRENQLHRRLDRSS